MHGQHFPRILSSSRSKQSNRPTFTFQYFWESSSSLFIHSYGFMRSLFRSLHTHLSSMKLILEFLRLSNWLFHLFVQLDVTFIVSPLLYVVFWEAESEKSYTFFPFWLNFEVKGLYCCSQGSLLNFRWSFYMTCLSYLVFLTFIHVELMYKS